MAVALLVGTADLAVEPGQSPARYRAVVLDATAVYRAVQDVDGVSAASIVTPPHGAPPPETAPDVAPDTQALDTLFNEAVLKVRRIDSP